MSDVLIIPIELDRPRRMRLTLAESLAFKRATTTPERPRGLSLLRGDLAGVEVAEEEWIALFHALLAWEDPDLTVEHVAEILDGAAYVRAGEVFNDLLAAFLPAGGAGEPGPSGTA